MKHFLLIIFLLCNAFWLQAQVYLTETEKQEILAKVSHTAIVLDAVDAKKQISLAELEQANELTKLKIKDEYIVLILNKSKSVDEDARVKLLKYQEEAYPKSAIVKYINSLPKFKQKDNRDLYPDRHKGLYATGLFSYRQGFVLPAESSFERENVDNNGSIQAGVGLVWMFAKHVGLNFEATYNTYRSTYNYVSFTGFSGVLMADLSYLQVGTGFSFITGRPQKVNFYATIDGGIAFQLSNNTTVTPIQIDPEDIVDFDVATVPYLAVKLGIRVPITERWSSFMSVRSEASAASINKNLDTDMRFYATGFVLSLNYQLK